jgi:hypothetical protein
MATLGYGYAALAIVLAAGPVIGLVIGSAVRKRPSRPS